MSQSPTITIVLPAYNEEKTIVEAITRIIKVLDESRIDFRLQLIVDGPGDRTAELARTISDDRLLITELERNVGKGRALCIGLELCTSEYVGYMDADLDLHPESLVDAYQKLTQRDLSIAGVLGSKVHPDSQVGYPLTRRIFSRVYRMFVKILFSMNIEDTQTGLKVFRRSEVERVLDSVRCDGFAFDLELLARMSRNGCKFDSVPIVLDFRFNSAVTLKSILEMIKDTFLVAIFIRRSN